MVIEEVNFMQNHLEIEKTCRESAEALATKVSCVGQSCACWSSNELVSPALFLILCPLMCSEREA